MRPARKILEAMRWESGRKTRKERRIKTWLAVGSNEFT
jgi:hypothetical protein